MGKTMRHPKDKHNRDADFQGDKGPEYAILLDMLEEMGWDLADMRALDMFAGNGSFRTVDLITRVGQFDAWDTSADKIKRLREKFPWVGWEVGPASKLAQWHVEHDFLKYDIISLDAPIKCYGKYCEHFEVLGLATMMLKPKGAIIMNVATKAIHGNTQHMQRRKEFYGRPAEDFDYQDLRAFYASYFLDFRKRVLYDKIEPHCYIDGYNFGLFVLVDR